MAMADNSEDNPIEIFNAFKKRRVKCPVADDDCPLCLTQFAEYRLRCENTVGERFLMSQSQSHLRTHAGLEEPGSLHCPVCFVKTDSPADLQQHITSDHGEAAAATPSFSVSDAPLYFYNRIASYNLEKYLDINLSVESEPNVHPKSACKVISMSHNSAKFSRFVRRKLKENPEDVSYAFVFRKRKVRNSSLIQNSWVCPFRGDSTVVEDSAGSNVWQSVTSLRLYMIRHLSKHITEVPLLEKRIRKEWKYLEKDLKLDLSDFRLQPELSGAIENRPTSIFMLSPSMCGPLVEKIRSEEDVYNERKGAMRICAICYKLIFLFNQVSHFTIYHPELRIKSTSCSEFFECTDLLDVNLPFPHPIFAYTKLYIMTDGCENDSVPMMTWKCPIFSCCADSPSVSPEFPYLWILKAYALRHLETKHPNLFSEAFYANEWAVVEVEMTMTRNSRCMMSKEEVDLINVRHILEQPNDVGNPNEFVLSMARTFLRVFGGLYICGQCFFTSRTNDFLQHITEEHGFVQHTDELLPLKLSQKKLPTIFKRESCEGAFVNPLKVAEPPLRLRGKKSVYRAYAKEWEKRFPGAKILTDRSFCEAGPVGEAIRDAPVFEPAGQGDATVPDPDDVSADTAVTPVNKASATVAEESVPASAAVKREKDVSGGDADPDVIKPFGKADEDKVVDHVPDDVMDAKESVKKPVDPLTRTHQKVEDFDGSPLRKKIKKRKSTLVTQIEDALSDISEDPNDQKPSAASLKAATAIVRDSDSEPVVSEAVESASDAHSEISGDRDQKPSAASLQKQKNSAFVRDSDSESMVSVAVEPARPLKEDLDMSFGNKLTQAAVAVTTYDVAGLPEADPDCASVCADTATVTDASQTSEDESVQRAKATSKREFSLHPKKENLGAGMETPLANTSTTPSTSTLGERRKESMQRIIQKYTWDGPPPPPLSEVATNIVSEFCARSFCTFCKKALHIDTSVGTKEKEIRLFWHILSCHAEEEVVKEIVEYKRYRLAQSVSSNTHVDPLPFRLEPGENKKLACASCEGVTPYRNLKLFSLKQHFDSCLLSFALQKETVVRNGVKFNRIASTERRKTLVKLHSSPSTSTPVKTEKSTVACPFCTQQWRHSIHYSDEASIVAHILFKHAGEKNAYDVASELAKTAALSSAYPFWDVEKSVELNNAAEDDDTKPPVIQCSKCKERFTFTFAAARHARRHATLTERIDHGLTTSLQCGFGCTVKIPYNKANFPAAYSMLMHILSKHLEEGEKKLAVEVGKLPVSMITDTSFPVDPSKSLELSLNKGSCEIYCSECEDSYSFPFHWTRYHVVRSANLKSGKSCASTPRLPSGRGEISNKSRVTCAWCSYTFATSERYDNAVLFACHVLSKHRSDAKCVSEFKEMYEVDALKTHVPLLDFDASLTLSDVRNKPALVCAQCGVSCAIINDLYKHSQRQHPELLPSTSSSSTTSTPSRVDVGRSVVVKKEVKNSVTQHEKKSSRESSVSASSSSPENVFRIDLEAKNRCLQCHFAARTSVDLDLHIVMRHGGVKVEELASTSQYPEALAEDPTNTNTSTSQDPEAVAEDSTNTNTSTSQDPEAVAEDSTNTNSVSEEVAHEKNKDDRMNGDKGEEQKNVHGDNGAGADSNDDDVTLMTLRKRTPSTNDTPTNEPTKNDVERKENVDTEDQMIRDADFNDKEMENDDVVTPSRRETRSAARARRESQTTKEKKRPRRSDGEEIQRKRARKMATVFKGGS